MGRAGSLTRRPAIHQAGSSGPDFPTRDVWPAATTPEYDHAVQDDITLLNQARALDEAALVEIHTRYYPVIYRYFSFRVADEQTAEDLTSEVFIRFLQAIRDRNSPPNTIRGWLFGAALNVLKEHYRAKKKMDVTLLDETIAAKGRSPEQKLEDRLGKERLRAALDELTVEQQHVLGLRFGYGLPIREVAAAVNKSEGAVKMLQARAIMALTQRLVGQETGQ